MFDKQEIFFTAKAKLNLKSFCFKFHEEKLIKKLMSLQHLRFWQLINCEIFKISQTVKPDTMQHKSYSLHKTESDSIWLVLTIFEFRQKNLLVKAINIFHVPEQHCSISDQFFRHKIDVLLVIDGVTVTLKLTNYFNSLSITV